MSMTFWGRTTLAIAILATAAACSVTDYEKPVSTFAEATRDAEEALVALDAQVTDAYAAELRALAVAGQEFVKIQSGDCLVPSDRCRLVIKAGETEELLSPNPALREMVTLMRAIRNYADGLTAIVTADTAAQVAMHVNATLGSIEALAGTVANLDGSGDRSSEQVPEFATPAGQAINWIVGQYVARVQLDGLRRATSHARTVVSDAADLFGETSDLASDVPKAALAEQVSKRVDAFREERSERNLERLIESAADYDRLLLAKSPNIFGRLKEAHNALADKLENDELSLADVMAKIETFAAEAKTLFKILQDLAALDAE